MKGKILKYLLVYIPAGFVILSLLLVTLLKWVPVAVTPLMLKRCVENIGNKDYELKYQWVPLEEISKAMVRAVIASEDNKFPVHNGFDFEEIGRMKEQHERKGKPIRGCSTISQQTAKNCFTFCSRTWVRKAFEAYYTVLIEKIWGKRRIMEVYLNVAEMGPGIFGVEAASQKYFHTHASRLSIYDASSLACCLPNPLRRTPDWVNRRMGHHKGEIVKLSYQISIAGLK